MISDKEVQHPTIDWQWSLLISVLILTLVLAFKRTYQRRVAANTEEAEEQAPARDALLQVRHSRQSSRCDQISKEEFNYQSSVVTRNEIMKLVHSDDYKEHV